MTDRLDTIRKRLASGSPFTAHAGDLAWAIGEIDRLKGDVAEVDMVLGIVGADREFRRVMLCTNRDRMKGLVADVAGLTVERDEARAAVVLCAEFHQEREESIVAENKLLKDAIWSCPEYHGIEVEELARAAAGADQKERDDQLAMFHATSASRMRANAAVMGDDARAEIARLDALSRATADDVEDAVPCLPCGKVECSCGDARDEMENA